MLNEKKAAEMLGVSPNTLRTWRSRPQQNANAPRPTKVGRCVRYSENELRRYLERNTK
jgi:uncharacterized protein YjcR